jgi:flagellar basal body-associated protein FliL
MGFDLTGYESDNMDMKPLALYTIAGILTLIVLIVAIYFYMFFMSEKYTQELFLERDTARTVNYKKQEAEYLRSHQLKAGIKEAINYYNE